MKTPVYQRVSDLLIKWILPGLALVGLLVGLWKNLNSVITPNATYVLTLLIILFWLIVEFIARTRGISWVINDQKTKLRRLGWGRRLALLTILFCLWIPRIVDYFTPKEEASTLTVDQEEMPALQLGVGDKLIAYGGVREIVYGIPTQLKGASFITTYILFQLENTSDDKTIEKVIIALRYPEGSQVVQTGSMRMFVLGEKDEQQVKRRTSTAEGVSFSYISVDDIGPGKAFLLQEPINIPSAMLNSPDTKVPINVQVSAKDLSPKTLQLRLRAIVCDSRDELSSKYKKLVYEEVVKNRKNLPPPFYLVQSISSSPLTSNLVIPVFQVAKNSKNMTGYLSDPMHDQWGSVSYNPAPLEYLFPKN